MANDAVLFPSRQTHIPNITGTNIMNTLSKRHQLITGSLLVALMVATRGHHLPTVQSMLPSASWAVFFLAGIYLRPLWFAGALMALAAGLDYVAITLGGVNDFCVSPAYIALLPAYATLWSAGRWYQNRTQLKAIAPLSLVGSVAISAVLCELISSGSFYVFSGRFATLSVAEFAQRFAQYFPSSLTSIAIWVSIATLIHGAILVARGESVFASGKR
jgi:hypothetical protein